MLFTRLALLDLVRGFVSRLETFVVTAVASVTTGQAFSVTVAAADQFNHTVSSYSGSVHFTSTDTDAVLPGNSALAGGRGTFAATLATVGTQTVTVSDTATDSIAGTSGNIVVTSGVPEILAEDHFAGVNSTPLELHSPDVGGPWVNMTTPTGEFVLMDGHTQTDLVPAVYTIDVGVNQVTVTCLIDGNASSARRGIAVGMTDGLTGWVVVLDFDGENLFIAELFEGVVNIKVMASIGPYTEPYQLTASVNGTTINALYHTSSRDTPLMFDTFGLTAITTSFGLYSQSNLVQFDDFVVTTP